MTTQHTKKTKVWIFAGAQTVNGDLANTFETKSERIAKKQLQNDPRGFYKELKDHKLAYEDQKVYVWVKAESEAV